MTFAQLMARHPSIDPAEQRRLQDLYEGGASFRARIADYLPKHAFEEAGAWVERQQRAAYENHVGPLIDQWVGEVWADPPQWEGELTEEDQALLDDCDRQGTRLTALWQACLTQALVHGCAWVLVDLPALPPGETVRDRAEARGRGLRPYLVPLHPMGVLDWDEEGGELTGVMVFGEASRRDGPESARGVTATWTWYDRQGWRRWAAAVPKTGFKDTDEIPLVAEGTHAAGRVPVVRLQLPAGLHLGAALKEPALSLFNAESALDWALYKTAFATLVIQRQWGAGERPVLGPGGYLQLEHEDKYGYMEPPGTANAALAERCAAKLQGLYRAARQVALSVAAQATRASGVTLREERRPAAIVAAVLGQMVRDALQEGIDLVAKLRTVTPFRAVGLADYDATDTGALVEEALAVGALKVPSVAFQTAYLSRVAGYLLPGADPKLRQQVQDEIAAGVATRAQADELLTTGGP